MHGNAGEWLTCWLAVFMLFMIHNKTVLIADKLRIHQVENFSSYVTFESNRLIDIHACT